MSVKSTIKSFGQNSQHCIQDAPMNTSISIFKIHIFQHFASIYEKSRFEISNLREQNTSLLKQMTEETDLCRNEHSFCFKLVALGQNIETFYTNPCKV